MKHTCSIYAYTNELVDFSVCTRLQGGLEIKKLVLHRDIKSDFDQADDWIFNSLNGFDEM